MEDSEKKPNYKIWHFGKDKWDKVVDERFYAEDDDAAYAHLQSFISKSQLDDSKKHYYSAVHYSCSVDDKGNKSPEFDIEDHLYRYKLWYDDKPFFARMCEEVKFFLSYWFIDKPRDFKYWVRDLVYLLKNKEEYSNQWNLDMHLLESIERNVPSLIKNSHSLAFIDDAILQMHSKDPSFDLDEYCKEHYCGYPKEVEDLAMKIQNEEYAKLLLHVKLYKYYSDVGSIDFDDEEQVKFDNEWRHTLPMKKGTYDEVSDYKKLIAMSREQWDAIWDWMKKHGQKLCD